MITRVERQWGDHRYFVSLARAVSREDFFARAKVEPGTYAGRMVEKIYHQIFDISLELKHDYCSYYQVEYESFERFLKKRFHLSPSEAQPISAAFDHSAVILEYKPLESFFWESAGQQLLEQLLEDPRQAKETTS